MPDPIREDRDLTPADIRQLGSADAVAGFFTHLGYPAETLWSPWS